MLASSDPDVLLRSLADEPALVAANGLVELIVHVDADSDTAHLVHLLMQLAEWIDEATSEVIVAAINADRVTAGVPPVTDDIAVATVRAEWQRHCVTVMRDLLDDLPSDAAVDVLTRLVEVATGNGTAHAPAAVDELVGRYEVEVESFLSGEAENLGLISERLLASIGSPAASRAAHLDTLEGILLNWDRVAQPLQLLCRARGLRHVPSERVAALLRMTAIRLHNEANDVPAAERINGMLGRAFAEVPEVAEQSLMDAEQLKANRITAQGPAVDLDYTADIGALIKSQLVCSATGITWKGLHLPWNAITYVRWGGVRHSVNGIPTGTTYHVVYGTATQHSEIRTRREAVYDAVVERLFRMTVPLLLERLARQAMGDGTTFIGPVQVLATGVVLTKRHLFSKAERVFVPWPMLSTSGREGALILTSKEAGQQVSVDLPLLHTDNAIVLAILADFMRDRGLTSVGEILP